MKATNSQEFRSGRWGVVWKNDRIYLFAPDRVMVLDGGPDPRCWIKTEKKPHWHSSRNHPNLIFRRYGLYDGRRCPEAYKGGYLLPDGQTVMPFGLSPDQLEQVYLHRFIHSVPPDIRARLLRFSDRQWQLYNLLARVPGAMELCDSNPSLTLALANSWAFKKKRVCNPLRAARSLVHKKQVEILRWLDFTPTNAVRRILRKVEPDAATVESLLYLRTVVSDPLRCKILSHLPKVSAGVIRIISDNRFYPFVSPAFYHDLAVHPSYTGANGCRDLFFAIRDAFDMAQALSIQIPVFYSLSALLAFHDRLSAHNWSDGLPQHFPEPPYPGTRTIQPIRTADELMQEARLQRNCCASYGARICRGEYYIYRAEVPLRVTIGINRDLDKNGHWHVDQIYQAGNQLVPPDITTRLSRELLEGAGCNAGTASFVSERFFHGFDF